MKPDIDRKKEAKLLDDLNVAKSNSTNNPIFHNSQQNLPVKSHKKSSNTDNNKDRTTKSLFYNPHERLEAFRQPSNQAQSQYQKKDKDVNDLFYNPHEKIRQDTRIPANGQDSSSRNYCQKQKEKRQLGSPGNDRIKRRSSAHEFSYKITDADLNKLFYDPNEKNHENKTGEVKVTKRKDFPDKKTRILNEIDIDNSDSCDSDRCRNSNDDNYKNTDDDGLNMLLREETEIEFGKRRRSLMEDIDCKMGGVNNGFEFDGGKFN